MQGTRNHTHYVPGPRYQAQAQDSFMADVLVPTVHEDDHGVVTYPMKQTATVKIYFNGGSGLEVISSSSRYEIRRGYATVAELILHLARQGVTEVQISVKC